MDLKFNTKPPHIIHIDINSCFATIEQQANPHLRGKPIAVAAYDSPGGCILAPSIEAKTYGVKTGMRVRDGRELCPDLIVMNADPNKYRHIHLGLRDLFAEYTADFTPKSIDEFVLNVEGYPCMEGKDIMSVAQEIKDRIKKDVGDWIWTSAGIGPSRYIAKTAAGLQKPDGLMEINHKNYFDIYSRMELIDLTGINVRNEARLKSVGINNVIDLYNAPVTRLKAAFQSVVSKYWYTRLRGWEIDNVEFARRSYGNSYALPKTLEEPKELSPVLAKLVNKMSSRLRNAGYKAQGVHLYITYKDGTGWGHGRKTKREIFDTREIFKEAYRILSKSPKKPVRNLAVSCFNLIDSKHLQLEIFTDRQKDEELMKAVDNTNERWGHYVITTANMLGRKEASISMKTAVPDRIAFGGVKELEEIVRDFG